MWMYRSDEVYPAFVGGEFGLEGLVFLHLSLEISWVSVRLITRHCQFCCDPPHNLRHNNNV